VKLTLTPAIVEDDDDLAEVVDDFVKHDPDAEIRQTEIIEQEEYLRRYADPGDWQECLHLEEMMNWRFADLLVTVARWAFEQGRSYPAQPSAGADGIVGAGGRC